AQETLTIPGLVRPVEIIVDRWGISHIYAETEHDLFFAQGFNAARDRLFQLEIWRRQATGTVAEILGRRELRRDIGTRLFMFRGDMNEELNHYHPRGATIIQAFVDGVNAYIERTEQDPDLLPMEFALLGIVPQKWTPAVVISRHQGLLGNITQELAFGRAVARIGPAAVKRLEYFHPGDPDIALDAAIDGDLLFADILGLYNAFRRPIRFAPEDIALQHRTDPAAYGRLAAAVPPTHERRSLPAGEDIGSNNWVVSGRLTQTGNTMMANDPHRTQSAPSLRYWVHLVGPGWNVLGAGEPEIPGVSIGHNEYGAWGLTVFATDGEDLYVYDTNPADPSQYRYQDRWEDMTVIEEQIAVEGEASVAVQLKYTRHGPVVYEDRDNHKAYAVRAAWMEVGGAPYLASLRMDQATTWEEFRDACRYSHIPGENMVWADVHGDIGWQAVGIAPIRRNWSGLVPIPGDGRYEWEGYLPIKQKPHVVNPEEGYWATANNNLVPPAYPHRDAVGWVWSDPYRWARASELLGSGRKHSIADMMRLQTDELSIPARTLSPLLNDLRAQQPLVERARRMLLDWDWALDRNSVAAGIYVAWERRLQRNMTDLFVPPEARSYIGTLAMKRIIDWLVAPPPEFGIDPIAGRDALLLRSLTEAISDLREKLGENMNDWRYGQERYKHALIKHPLSDAVDEETRRMLNVGPAPRGGNSYTLNNSGGGDNQTAGPSFRIILEAGNWDAAVGANNPGQSGDPETRHYRDLYELWSTDRYFPAYYSRAKIEAVPVRTLSLQPSGAPPR
ncbi:MAG: penicillin acylase family protein, partial [Gemmatimonadales bacterium]